MDCVVHGVAKSWTQLREFHFHRTVSHPWQKRLRKESTLGQSASSSSLKKYIFIWLHQGLVSACKICSCSTRTLSCGMWNLVPQPGIEPWPHALGMQSQPPAHQGSPCILFCRFQLLLSLGHLPEPASLSSFFMYSPYILNLTNECYLLIKNG